MPDLTYQDLNRLSIDEALNRLKTDSGGLSPDEAKRRLETFGRNVLIEQRRYSMALGLGRHFTHFLAILLWIAAALSFAVDYMRPGEGMATLGWAIVSVIVINAVFAFFQEYRAERTVQALHRLLPDKAWVTREGQAVEVANVFACRSDRLSVARLGWFINPLILWGILTELSILVVITYTPMGNDIFGTSPLPAWIWGPIALGALALLFAEESRKFIVNRFDNSRADDVSQHAGAS